MLFLAAAVLPQPAAWPQSLNLTTEYIRAGGRLVAVLHQPPAYFTDVGGTTYANEANLLYADGITAGCGGGQFCGSATLTREQMAILIITSIYVALQGPGQGGNFTYNPTPYFADVPSGYWAFKWIQKMYELGITAGCNTNPLRYCPADSTSNFQMAVFSTNARQYVLFGSASYPFSYPPWPYWADVPSNGAGFAQIQYMTSLGVISPGGCNPCYFNPNNAITRGQSAPYLVRGILDDFSY